MTPLEGILTRMGGYTPHMLEDEPREERQAIIKLGWAVALAVLVAAANWATAGWAYSEGVSTPVRIAIAAAGATLGGSIVLVFDRGFIYFSDTSEAKGLSSLIAYGFFRIFIILLVSSITSQAINPIVMGKELAAHALPMTEKSEAGRLLALGNQYDLGSRKLALDAANGEVKRLEKLGALIPADIRKKLTAARGCWSDYSIRKTRLLHEGVQGEKLRERLSGKAARCAKDSSAASAERDAYIKRTREQLDTAVALKTQAATDLAGASAAINEKIDRASRVEAEALTPRSSSVLWSLLKSDPGALGKWVIISLTLLLLELFPIIQKAQAGRTGVGRRIAADRAIMKRQTQARLLKAEHDATIAEDITKASMAAVAEALDNPEVKKIFTRVFAANVAAQAPTQAVQAMMEEFSKQFDVDKFMRRFPRYASVIAQAWSNAIQETADILKRGIHPSPTQGPPT